MAPDLETLVPPGPVLVPMAVAIAMEPLAWALSLGPGVLDAGWYGRGSLLVVVHCITLGCATAAIFGAGWQLVPVVTARPWSPPAGALSALFLSALPLLLYGMAAPGLVGTLGACGVVVALLVRSGFVVHALLTASGRRVARGWLLAAEASLWAGLVVAGLLWAGKVGHPVLVDPIAGVRLHVSLLLGGWVGGSVVGYGCILLPMFAIAPEPRPALLGVAAALWFTGLATGALLLTAAGGVVIAAVLGNTLRLGLRRNLGQPLAGLGGLAALAVMLPWAPGPVVVSVGLALALLPMLRGMTQKIAPYLLWARFSSTSAVPSPPRFTVVQAPLSWTGAVMLTAGLGSANGLANVGAALLLVGALVHLAGLLVVGAKLGLTYLRQGAIPGMESSP